MKRIIAIALAALIAVSVMIPMLTVSAIDNPSFVVGDAIGKVGENVDVIISVENNPGITALQLKVDYNDDELELVGVNDGGLFGNAITNSKLTNKPFKISWYSNESANESESGVLVTLTFKIMKEVDESVVNVSYDADNVFDINFNNVCFDMKSGVITIEPENSTADTTPTEIVKPTETTAPSVNTVPSSTTEPSSGTSEPDHPFLLGDANLDTVVNVKDATTVQKYVASLIDLSAEAKICADFDQNENINVKDATGIQKKVAGLI